jgi:hypothetical protein
MWKHKFKKEINATDEEKQALIEKYLETQEEAKKNRQEIASLQKEILDIMESEQVDRLFADKKIVSRTCRQTFGYDEEKLKEILEKRQLWDKVVKVNQTQLNKALKTLPSNEKQEVEKIKELKSESYGLSVKKEK